jgi:hypothetical protein
MRCSGLSKDGGAARFVLAIDPAEVSRRQSSRPLIQAIPLQCGDPRLLKPRASGYFAGVDGAYCSAEATGRTTERRLSLPIAVGSRSVRLCGWQKLPRFAMKARSSRPCQLGCPCVCWHVARLERCAHPSHRTKPPPWARPARLSMPDRVRIRALLLRSPCDQENLSNAEWANELRQQLCGILSNASA